MSHTTEVKMIADQEIEICGKIVNIHDILSITVNSKGKITNAFIEGKGWLKE